MLSNFKKVYILIIFLLPLMLVKMPAQAQEAKIDSTKTCEDIHASGIALSMSDLEDYVVEEAIQLPAGQYLLDEDVSITIPFLITSEVEICLNGNIIRYIGTTLDYVFRVEDSGVLTILDCGTTAHSYTKGDDYLYSFIEGSGTLIGGVITGGTLGAISVEQGSFNLYGGTIAGNSGIEGSAVKCFQQATFAMYGGSIRGNNAQKGAVYIDNATLHMLGGTIGDNFSLNGGGIYAKEGNLILDEDSQIIGNVVQVSTKGVGGGLALITEGQKRIHCEINGAQIEGNMSHNGAGMFASGYVEILLSDANITRNHAVNAGGGIYITDGAKLAMQGGIVGEENLASNGAGVFIGNRAEFDLSGGKIIGNHASTEGGGINANAPQCSFKISGAPIIKDNKNSTTDDNIVLLFIKMEIAGSLSDGDSLAEIHYTNSTENEITTNFSLYYPNSDPSQFFIFDNGYPLLSSTNEVLVGQLITFYNGDEVFTTRTVVRKGTIASMDDIPQKKPNSEVHYQFAYWRLEDEPFSFGSQIAGNLSLYAEYNAVPHRPSEWIYLHEPNCLDPVFRHKECLDCGIVVEEEISLVAAHSYGTLIPEISPTCKTTGWAAYYQCDLCKKYFDAEHNEVEYDSLFLDRIDHILGDWIIDIEPTCTTSGHHHRDCIMCHNTIIDEDVEPHQLQYYEEITPTCTTSGRVAYYQCQICKRIFNESKEEITMDDLFLPPSAHSVDYWIMDLEPTCLEEGLKHGECMECGHTISEKIPAKGHDLTSFEMVQKPNQLSYQAKQYLNFEGMKLRGVCSICGEVEIEDFKASVGVEEPLTINDTEIKLSYKEHFVSFSILVTPIQLDISFTDLYVLDDGKAHSITISSNLPEDVVVNYEDNTHTLPGVYEVVAHFEVDLRYYTPISSKRAKLVILKKTLYLFQDLNGLPTDPEVLRVVALKGFYPTQALELKELPQTKDYEVKGIAWEYLYQIHAYPNELNFEDNIYTISLYLPYLEEKEYCIYDLETKEELEYSISNGYVIFQADHLGNFGIGYKTSSTSFWWIWLIVGLVVGIGLITLGVLLYIKFKRNKEKDRNL